MVVELTFWYLEMFGKIGKLLPADEMAAGTPAIALSTNKTFTAVCPIKVSQARL